MCDWYEPFLFLFVSIVCRINLTILTQNKKRYVLVKGTNLFVFAKDTSPAPKYAVTVPHKKIILHKSIGQTQMVTIENGLGDVEYKFKFDLRENENVAKNFVIALKEEAVVGETNEIKEVSWSL